MAMVWARTRSDRRAGRDWRIDSDSSVVFPKSQPQPSSRVDGVEDGIKRFEVESPEVVVVRV